MCVCCYYYYSQGRKEGDPSLFSPCLFGPREGPSTVPALCVAHLMQFSGQLQKVVLYQRRRKGFKSISDVPGVTPLWGYSAHSGHMGVHYIDSGKVGRWDMQQKETNQCSPGLPGWGWGLQDGRSGRADSGIPGEEAYPFSHRH